VPQEMTVLGAGSWGTALAAHLAHIGHQVRLWSIEATVVADIRERRLNTLYLPGVTMPASVEPTTDLQAALAHSGMVVAAVPSQAMRAVIRQAAPLMAPGAIVVSVAKGLELDTLLRMSQVIAQETAGRHPVAALSGPSFAVEVARQLPTAVSVACADQAAAEHVQAEFRARFFRLYATADLPGVEIGGALKNTIAVAAGVVHGLGLGHNALAALITRGLAEISRLAAAEGGRRETLAGLAGLGDLVLTCTGPYSRNRHVGIELAAGRPLAEILAQMPHVAEGVKTTVAALALGAARGIELPITAKMADVFTGRTSPSAALDDLMLRPQRGEVDTG
jgi:glycerol-3-phosphate dehydrogenase (NAD(P)+)